MEKAEIRVGDWSLCVNAPWYPGLSNGGYVAYRIWQQTDGLRWHQRHEWKCTDGTVEMDNWINGVSRWGADAKPVAEAS